MPRDIAEHYAGRGLVQILDLKLPVSLGRIGLVTHKDRQLSPAASAFMDEVRQIASTRASPRAGRDR
jgi:DNA-binding transcriptional LysR family regulator